MTATTYKQKAPTVQAIEFTDVLRQSADVANLIGSQAYQVDVKTKATTFVMDDRSPLIVKEGQVVSLSEGTASVSDSTVFYALYEAV
ncbi:hypothetical protein HBO34_15970 [Pseudomonas veronii]|uniref:hypothetical protein n=1 Tax=Pseudomonas veronii TaxID=76761 RepID=UPI0014728224|nr:hypothetical protein [Pseudomonas veronii]NMX39372.1 hypothetical protein [Pseudomonas veronii]